MVFVEYVLCNTPLLYGYFISITLTLIAQSGLCPIFFIHEVKGTTIIHSTGFDVNL